MPHLRRTRFYVPAHRPAKIIEALLSGVDGIVFDLEDLTPAAEKDAARILTRYALEQTDFGDTEVMVRVNNYATPCTALDLEVLNARVGAVLYPKAESPAEMQRLDRELAARETALGLKTGRFEIIPAIESAVGLLRAYALARASWRITAISVGAADLTRDLKAKKTATGIELLHAKAHVVTVARAAGIQPLDTVYPGTDEEGLIRETEESFSLGFEGKGVIRAAQVAVIHTVYEQVRKS